MSVSSTTTKNSHAGNGSTTAFAYGFKIFADSDLEVIIRSSTGTETTKTITTHYTVAGAGNDAGGTVTFTTGNTPASGETVVIRRKLTLTQGTDYVENDPFPADSHEDALDRLTYIAQGIQEELDRSFKVSKTNSITTTEFTEGSSDRANKLLSFDASGDLSVAQELGIYRGDWAASTSYDVRDLVKDTSTNNIFIATTAHTSSGSQPLTTNADSAKWSLIVDAASASTSAAAAASSATAAASSASAAATSESNASSSASSASTSAGTATTKASEASTSAASAAASFDDFDDRYLGAKSSEPSADNDGDALATGALFFDTTAGAMKVFNGSAWEAAFVGGSGFLAATNNLSDVSAAATARTNLGLGTIATQAANSVSISGGSVTGITDLTVADGGTGASTFTANGVLVGNGTSALQVTAPGSSGQILTSNGSGSAPTFQNAAAASGVVTATASGSITAGKTCILNANGTVSEISATAIAHAISSSTYTQSGETTAESNGMVYDTTDNHFIWAGRNTIGGSATGRTYALNMNSSLVISEAAPPITLNGSHLGVWSVKYCPAMQRTIVHAQSGSPYAAVSANTVNVVSGAMKASNQLVWTTTNRPYGTTNCFDANELILNHSTTTSPTGPRIRFVTATLGTDASGDTFASPQSEIDVGEGDMTSQTHTYYHQIIHFTVADKWMFGSFKQSSSGFGLGYSVGTIGGSEGSRTFTSQSAGTIPASGSFSDPPHSYMGAGTIEYDSTKDRAFFFDNEHLYSISVGSDGVLKQSSLVRIQDNHVDGEAKRVISIPNSDHIVLFFNDEDNSDRISYQVVRFTKGTDATADVFTLEGSVTEITTQTAVGTTPVAYSPDVDAFLIKPSVSSAVQPFVGVRVARTVTNVKATGTTEVFLGVAKNTVSNGQSVEIAVTGSVATMASGGMTIGDTQYVQNDGSVGTINRGYGTAGIAVSATEILLE